MESHTIILLIYFKRSNCRIFPHMTPNPIRKCVTYITNQHADIRILPECTMYSEAKGRVNLGNNIKEILSDNENNVQKALQFLQEINLMHLI